MRHEPGRHVVLASVITNVYRRGRVAYHSSSGRKRLDEPGSPLVSPEPIRLAIACANNGSQQQSGGMKRAASGLPINDSYPPSLSDLPSMISRAMCRLYALLPPSRPKEEVFIICSGFAPCHPVISVQVVRTESDSRTAIEDVPLYSVCLPLSLRDARSEHSGDLCASNFVSSNQTRASDRILSTTEECNIQEITIGAFHFQTDYTLRKSGEFLLPFDWILSMC